MLAAVDVLHGTNNNNKHSAVCFMCSQGLWLASAECNSNQDSGGVRPLPIQEHTLLLH
jgi:hypothetical protein